MVDSGRDDDCSRMGDITVVIKPIVSFLRVPGVRSSVLIHDGSRALHLFY